MDPTGSTDQYLSRTMRKNVYRNWKFSIHNNCTSESIVNIFLGDMEETLKGLALYTNISQIRSTQEKLTRGGDSGDASRISAKESLYPNFLVLQKPLKLK